MGGVIGSLAGMVACQHYGARLNACYVLMSDDVNMPDIEPELWNRSYKDARITHVAAIEPGFIWGLQSANVAGLVSDTITMMIGFGAGEDRLLATDFDASSLANLLPTAKIERFAPAFHFTAIPLCKPEGAEILHEDNDDPVCTDPAGTDRAVIHATIVNLIAGQLGL